MRQVKLKAINYPGKTHYIKFNMYSVFLGNGSKNYFSNHKDAKQFLADTNRFLNLKLHEFNHVFISVQSEYQRNWFYFDSQNDNANKNLENVETKIIENIQGVIKSMNFIVKRCGYPNGNHYTFTSFFNCINFCLEIIDNLIIMLKERKHYIEIKDLEILISQLERINQDLNAYGKDEKAKEKPLEDMEFIS